MGLFSRFEGRMENTIEGTADKMGNSPISPVQIMKKAEKEMRREKIVGSGKQYAPTLYTVLVNVDDDNRLFGYYPTLAGEAETYLTAKAADYGLVMDGQPLVRFIADEGLKHGKFEVIAEMVAAPIVAELREEENQRYGIKKSASSQYGAYGQNGSAMEQDPYGSYRNGAPAYSEEPNYYGAPAGANQMYGQDYGNAAAPYAGQDGIDRMADFPNESYNNYGAPSNFPAQDVASPSYPAQAQEAAARPGAYGAAAAGAFGMPVAGEQTALLDQQGYPQNNQAAPYQDSEKKPCLAELASKRLYEIVGSRVTLGRESANDIQVPDINASRRHAEIVMDNQGNWVLSDLGSTNGTMVNGRRVAVVVLRFGDQISIGTTKFVFTLA